MLRAAVAYTNLTTGTRLTDAHNGLRVLHRDVVERLDITQNRMAHASEIVAQIGSMRFDGATGRLCRGAGAHPLHRLLQGQGPVALERRQHPGGADLAMRQLGIQILLIVGTSPSRGGCCSATAQRAQALRRLGLLAFAAFAVWSILDPERLWTSVADALGVGRGADLILYGLVVAFFGFVVTTFRRFRDMETRYTRLARRIALDESEPAVVHRSRSDTGSPAVPGTPTSSGLPIDTPTQPEAPDAD